MENIKFEIPPSNIERLRQFEQTGEYLFHGSAVGNIEQLEPRQGKHTQDNGEIIDDGQPSISATPYLDLALFRGIVNPKNIRLNHTSWFGTKSSGDLLFKLSNKQALDEALNNKQGFVYVFEKKDFKPYNRSGNADENSMEWRSDRPIKPIDVIAITSENLPDKSRIEILE